MGLLTADKVAQVLAKGSSARLPCDRPAAFKPGDRVRAKTLHPDGHIRLPGYAKGRRGTVVRDQGGFIFPDSHADGRPAEAQRLYSVRFEAQELWGNDAENCAAVYIDLFEPYLEAI